MNKYVGTAKNVPDSRMPRRFIAIRSSDRDRATVASWPLECGDRARGVLRPGGDAHRDREHVVDEQGAGHGHARVRPRLTVATS